MTPNALSSIQVRDRALSPAQAEIWITVLPDHRTTTTELRGRLTGPRCVYASTIEVAYPLRPLPRPPEGWPGHTMRVVIPEPSLWDPESPFLYEGTVELRQDGQSVGQVQLTHGLRWLHLVLAGLRLNGQALPLHGIRTTQCSEADARHWRQQGVNLLLAPVQATDLWTTADRLGFLMLGRVERDDDLAAALRLGRHASAFGLLLPAAPKERPTVPPPFLGIELIKAPEQPLPATVDFVVCREELLSHLAEVRQPRLVLAKTGPAAGTAGWIDT